MSRTKRPVIYDPLIFNCFKPAGPTSFDIVNYFKRNLPTGFGKIGHFGTLDPFASGVLLIGIAEATKLMDVVSGLPKTYIAVGKLGVESDSGDIEGNIVSTSELSDDIKKLSNKELEKIFKQKFVGEIMQSPPSFSASKYKGKPLYSYARKGELIQKEAVSRIVYDLSVLKFSPPYLSIKFTVSSGTYIRTLFEDLAKEIGTIGLLLGLVRESIGNFSIANSIFKKDWPEKDHPFDIYLLGTRPDKLFSLEEKILSASEFERYRNGDLPESSSFSDVKTSRCWLKTGSGRTVGLVDIENEVRALVKFQNVIDRESASE